MFVVCLKVWVSVGLLGIFESLLRSCVSMKLLFIMLIMLLKCWKVVF